MRFIKDLILNRTYHKKLINLFPKFIEELAETISGFLIYTEYTGVTYILDIRLTYLALLPLEGPQYPKF